LEVAGRRQEGPFEYSDAYAVRLTIHKIASFATVPLFVLQYIAGQQLIEHEGGGGNGFREDDGEGGGGLAEWHGTLAAGVAGLFAAAITGSWNLRAEGSREPYLAYHARAAGVGVRRRFCGTASPWAGR
jgi:hypothetical protein